MPKVTSKIILFLSTPILAFTLSDDPWIPLSGEIKQQTEFTYSRFSHVSRAKKPLAHAFNDYELLFGLGFSASDLLNFQLDAELANTPEQNFGWRSFAGQAQYQCLDDRKSDPYNLAIGFNARIVSFQALGDISSPYAAKADFELFSSYGLSWMQQENWMSRFFGVVAVGQGTRGAPWLRGDIAYQHKWGEEHQLNFFADSLWGLGHKRKVNLHRFHKAHMGWGKYRHFSIDTGAEYRYDFGKWGQVYASYAFRIFARDFPEYVNSFMIGYCLPLKAGRQHAHHAQTLHDSIDDL